MLSQFLFAAVCFAQSLTPEIAKSRNWMRVPVWMRFHLDMNRNGGYFAFALTSHYSRCDCAPLKGHDESERLGRKCESLPRGDDSADSNSRPKRMKGTSGWQPIQSHRGRPYNLIISVSKTITSKRAPHSLIASSHPQADGRMNGQKRSPADLRTGKGKSRSSWADNT